MRAIEKVTDYRTHVSGIRAEHINGSAAVSFKTAQFEVSEILKERLLVGHSVHHDLQALLLDHPRRLTRDTALYKVTMMLVLLPLLLVLLLLLPLLVLTLFTRSTSPSAAWTAGRARCGTYARSGWASPSRRASTAPSRYFYTSGSAVNSLSNPSTWC